MCALLLESEEEGPEEAVEEMVKHDATTSSSLSLDLQVVVVVVGVVVLEAGLGTTVTHTLPPSADERRRTEGGEEMIPQARRGEGRQERESRGGGSRGCCCVELSKLSLQGAKRAVSRGSCTNRRCVGGEPAVLPPQSLAREGDEGGRDGGGGDAEVEEEEFGWMRAGEGERERASSGVERGAPTMREGSRPSP